MDEIKLSEPMATCMEFRVEKDWVMKITPKGIFFNRETFTDSSPDEFAKAVLDIIEYGYDVKFTRKEPPYNRVDNG